MKRLKMSRMMAGFTQLQLARKTGLSEQQVTKIETGRLNPSPRIKQRLAHAIGVAESELFAQEDVTKAFGVRKGARHE